MGIFDILKKRKVNQEKKESYLEVNFNKFNYTDGMLPERLNFLQGQIKQLTQFSYKIEKGEKILECSTAVFSFTFDRNKKITKETRYRSENDISSITKYLDFQNNKPLTVHRYFIPNIVTSKDIYEYDNKKECVSLIEYEYNEEGNETKHQRLFYDLSEKCFMKEISANGTFRIEPYNTSLYNPLNPPQYENLGEDGFRQIIQVQDSKTIDTFDKFKKFLASRRYDGSDNLKVEIEVTYDEEYKRKTYALYDYKNKTKSVSYYHYDKNGFLVKLENPNIETDIVIFENDKFGNMLKKFTKWRKAVPEEEFEYEYDHLGNWTKRTMWYKEKIINIRTRKLEYYTD